MRISYVTETFAPQINGVALTAERTLRHLRAAGHQVELLRPRQAGEPPCSTLDEWRTAGGNLSFLHHRAYFGVAGSNAIRRRWHLAGQLPDVVHVATCGPLAWAALAAARAEGIATSAELRFNAAAHERRAAGWAAPLQLAWQKRLHRMADCSFVPTRALAGRLTALGFENLQVLGRGVDSTSFSPQWRDCWLRRDWRACNHNPVLLYVGRLSADKNVQLALQTFELLRQEERALRMVVVGDGPLRRQLQARHPRVRFAGWQRGTELARHYASADVCLFPGLAHGFGSITLEAMASGLALVAFDTAAASLHVSDGKNGFLARPDGSAAARQQSFLAAARRALGAAAVDHPLREQARLAALRADWHGALGGFEARLHSLASRAPAAPGGMPHWSGSAAEARLPLR